MYFFLKYYWAGLLCANKIWPLSVFWDMQDGSFCLSRNQFWSCIFCLNITGLAYCVLTTFWCCSVCFWSINGLICLIFNVLLVLYVN